MKIVDATDTKKATRAALAVLADGGLVAVPTETVYGLAADAGNGEAVAKIFAVKGRPAFNPLICHVADISMAERFGIFNPLARQLAHKFWPGPLTLVVPINPDGRLHELISSGLNTIALRQPQGIMAEIAAKLDTPLAAPSANTSGGLSPTTARHVADDLGDEIDLILDGGPCKIGLESTIVKLVNDESVLLRSGGITLEALEAEFPVKRLKGNTKIEAPGMMTSHYAPRADLRLNVDGVQNDQALLAFGPPVSGDPLAMLNLSVNGNLIEAAANLYGHLKQLDATGVNTIAVQKIPFDGLGEAINDRLERAAAPRGG